MAGSNCKLTTSFLKFSTLVVIISTRLASRGKKRQICFFSTANLTESTMAIFMDIYFEDDRQPKMAAETGNTYISGTMTDGVEIPMANVHVARGVYRRWGGSGRNLRPVWLRGKTPPSRGEEFHPDIWVIHNL